MRRERSAGFLRKPGAMCIVRLALRRPYTFIVLALLILIVGPLTLGQTATDIFATIALYFFSRTLVPTLAKYLLRAGPQHDAGAMVSFARLHHAFEGAFARFSRRVPRLARALDDPSLGSGRVANPPVGDNR